MLSAMKSESPNFNFIQKGLYMQAINFAAYAINFVLTH